MSNRRAAAAGKRSFGFKVEEAVKAAQDLDRDGLSRVTIGYEVK